MTSLPLPLRKNIRDTEAKRDEHLDTIKSYLNLSERPTLEASPEFWADLDAKIDSAYKNRGGDVVHDYVLGGLASGLQKAFTGGWYKSPACRDAFGQAWTTRKVKVDITGKDRPYHEVLLVDGVLIVRSSPANIATNVDDIGADPSVLLTCHVLYDGIHYRWRMNYDNGAGEKIDAALASLKDALGKDVTLEVKWDVLGAGLKQANSGDEEWYWRSPDWAAYSVDALAYWVKPKLSDDMVKEALLEKWTTGKINFQYEPKLQDKFGKNYNAIGFNAGNLVIHFNSVSNNGDVGQDIEERL